MIILIVDDNLASLEATAAAIEGPDRTIVKLPSGAATLRYLLNKRADLMLLDVAMPVMDGFQLARHIKERNDLKNIPILFITAFHQDELDLRTAYNIGAHDFIFKPIDTAILRAKVDAWISLIKKRKADRHKKEEWWFTSWWKSNKENKH